VSRAEAARAQAARAAQTLAHGLGEHAALCPCSADVAAASPEDAPADPAGPADPSSADPSSAVAADSRADSAVAAHVRSAGSGAPDGGAGAAVVSDHREVVATHRAATRALRGLTDAAAALARARRSADTTRARLATALSKAGFADAAAARAAMLPTAELTRMSAHLRSLDTQRDQAEALLAQPDVAAAEQQPAPDLDALAAAAVAAREVATQSRRAQAIAESADRRIHQLRDEVLAIVNRIGPAEAEQAVVQELADCVAGTSGNNTLRMRLSSYLLAARLEEVARLANERLQVMTEGRYSLVYSDALARRGARSGLGLRVVDAWTGVSRETSTLSGGESFMASLALALGLGDAVRAEAGGFDLQTLFVDEGFGTLDDESLEQVMGVLDSLREGGRSVGIVSHVSELRQRIPAQLRVTKSQAGSTIDVISTAVADVA
jgi:DNA repair protein SbcC/Rad50